MSWERMIYVFKTHPFNMSFEEIRAMTFRQACILMEEMGKVACEKAEAANALAKRSKEVMPVLDITRGIYD